MVRSLIKNKWIVRWKKFKSSYDIYHVADQQIFYRPESYDRFILDELWQQDEYFLDQIQLPEEGVIIDIGAHIGAFALRASHYFPNRQIFAFEPESYNYQLLKKNITTNKCQKITAIQAAVTGTSNRIKLYLSNRNTAGHSSIYQEGSESIFVPALQLEQIYTQYNIEKVALLKIDCEGGEYDILANMSPKQFDKIHYLAIEYHPVEEQNFTLLKQWLTYHQLQLIAHKKGYFQGQGTALFINTK